MSEGDGDQVQLDATDQAYMQHRMTSGGLQGLFPAYQVGAIAETFARAESKAALAQSQAAGGSMLVDPDQIDKLAQFFEDEAQGLVGRVRHVQNLTRLKPAGQDPVSTGSTEVFRSVAGGDQQAYMDNYLQLSEYFQKTASNLRAYAKQNRTDDQNAAEGFGGELA